LTVFEARPVDGRLLEEVKRLVDQQDSLTLKALLEQMRPADVADVIEHSGREEGLLIFRLLEPEGAGEVLMEIEAPVRERILKDLDSKAISQIVEVLNSDDAADVVGNLPADRAREVIEAVGDQVTEELRKLLTYPEDTAGGIMALEFVAVKASATVGDAIESIREKREEVENLYYI
jgi:magnesium transporter